jgi:hypothetical protein
LRHPAGCGYLTFPFSRLGVARSIFNPRSTANFKIGNKTVDVWLTDRRFAATFFARYFRPKP